MVFGESEEDWDGVTILLVSSSHSSLIVTAVRLSNVEDLLFNIFPKLLSIIFFLSEGFVFLKKITVEDPSSNSLEGTSFWRSLSIVQPKLKSRKK